MSSQDLQSNQQNNILCSEECTVIAKLFAFIKNHPKTCITKKQFKLLDVQLQQLIIDVFKHDKYMMYIESSKTIQEKKYKNYSNKYQKNRLSTIELFISYIQTLEQKEIDFQNLINQFDLLFKDQNLELKIKTKEVNNIVTSTEGSHSFPKVNIKERVRGTGQSRLSTSFGWHFSRPLGLIPRSPIESKKIELSDTKKCNKLIYQYIYILTPDFKTFINYHINIDNQSNIIIKLRTLFDLYVKCKFQKHIQKFQNILNKHQININQLFNVSNQQFDVLVKEYFQDEIDLNQQIIYYIIISEIILFNKWILQLSSTEKQQQNSLNLFSQLNNFIEQNNHVLNEFKYSSTNSNQEKIIIWIELLNQVKSKYNQNQAITYFNDLLI